MPLHPQIPGLLKSVKRCHDGRIWIQVEALDGQLLKGIVLSEASYEDYVGKKVLCRQRGEYGNVFQVVLASSMFFKVRDVDFVFESRD